MTLTHIQSCHSLERVGGGANWSLKQLLPACVAMKSLGKIFAQQPLWMSEITSVLELDPLGLKTSAQLSHSVIPFSPLLSLIYSFSQLSE